MTRADVLASVLDEFLAASPEVEAAAVVSGDGLPMASALPPSIQEDGLAAMSAALLSLGDRTVGGLGKGDLSHVFVDGREGHVALMSAGDAVLVAVSSKDAKAGLVLFEMRKAAANVASAMERPVAPVPPPAPLQRDVREAANGEPGASVAAWTGRPQDEGGA